VLPFTPNDGARFKAKELIESLLTKKIKHEFSSVSSYVTVSIGIATKDLANNADNGNELIKQADIALYRAKEQGRNCYQVFQETVEK